MEKEPMYMPIKINILDGGILVKRVVKDLIFIMKIILN